MSNRLLHVSIFTLVLFCFLNSSCKQTTIPKQIVIIQSYEAGFPAYKEIKKIFADQLQKREIQAEVHSIYLDCIKRRRRNKKCSSMRS